MTSPITELKTEFSLIGRAKSEVKIYIITCAACTKGPLLTCKIKFVFPLIIEEITSLARIKSNPLEGGWTLTSYCNRGTGRTRLTSNKFEALASSFLSKRLIVQ